MKVTIAGRILIWQTLHSSHLLLPSLTSVYRTGACWLHIFQKDYLAKIKQESLKLYEKHLVLKMFLEDGKNRKKGLPTAQLFIQPKTTNNGVTWFSMCKPTRWTSCSYWSISQAQWNYIILCFITMAYCQWHTLAELSSSFLDRFPYSVAMAPSLVYHAVFIHSLPHSLVRESWIWNTGQSVPNTFSPFCQSLDLPQLNEPKVCSEIWLITAEFKGFTSLQCSVH